MNTHHQHNRHPAPYPEGGHAGALARAGGASHAGGADMSRTRVRGRSEESPADSGSGSSPSRQLARTILPVLGLTLLAGALLLGLAAAILCRLPDPTTPARPVAYGILAAMAVLGGILAGRFNPQIPVPAGLASGGVLALVLLVLSWLVGKGSDISGALPAALPHVMRFSLMILHALVAYMTRPRPRQATHTAGGHGAHHMGGRR